MQVIYLKDGENCALNLYCYMSGYFSSNAVRPLKAETCSYYQTLTDGTYWDNYKMSAVFNKMSPWLIDQSSPCVRLYCRQLMPPV